MPTQLMRHEIIKTLVDMIEIAKAKSSDLAAYDSVEAENVGYIEGLTHALQLIEDGEIKE